MRESRVEKHLRVGVEELEGLCLKFVSPSRANVPDRLILLHFIVPHEVETKAPGKDATAAQGREHDRHRERNMPVLVLDTIAKVEHYLSGLRMMRSVWRSYEGPFSGRDMEFRCASRSR